MLTKSYGITFGAFDLLHPGHLHFLKEAKLQCLHLIVGLHTDPSIERKEKNKPIQTMYERYIQLKSCVYVNDVIPYDTENDLINILATNLYQVRFLGDEYKNEIISGSVICFKKDIELVYIPRLHSYSSTELRKRLINEPSK